jgi:hypothetical protein
VQAEIKELQKQERQDLGTHSQKVLSMVTLWSNNPMALTFWNVFQGPLMSTRCSGS